MIHRPNSGFALSYESMMVAEPSNTIALSGVSFSRLSQYLKDNPQTKHIIMRLDNDEVGISTSKKMADHCALLGYNVMLGFRTLAGIMAVL